MIRSREVKTVLNKHKRRDNWFLTEYSVNPYEGCSCNCLYCYIRGSKYGENMADSLSGLTLFGRDLADSRTLYYKFLQRHEPSLIAKYDQLFGEGTSAPAAYHSMLKARADVICKKYNLRTKILA